jgi:para-nitrobenzyl esterase
MGEPVAVTTYGMVSGVDRDGVALFRGVPYGASTAGARRFRPPASPEPWSGVRACLRYGLPSPQPIGATILPDEIAAANGAGNPMAMGEDCLVLNVWTPGLDDAPRPVMVWLHGGGFVLGSGASPVTSGEQLARRGDVVVVTVNHRLGALGFLHLAELESDLASSGMNGMLDIQAALEWVRDNIAAFGGDSGNVTIFGESGGGVKVSTLLAMPAAAGLFHRAIVQSGPGLRAKTADAATATATALMNELAVATVDGLRSLPFERFVEAQSAIGGGDPLGGADHGFAPVVDGHVLPRHPYEPDAAPTAAGVPLLIGTNRDEMTLLLAPRPDFGNMDEETARRIAGGVGPGAAELFTRYRALHPEWSPTDVAVALTSDRFRVESIAQAERHLATGTPAYVYLFTWESPMAGGKLKAAHTVEVSLVFDNVHRDAGAAADEKVQLVADAMSEAWLAFARTGNPNHPGIPTWPTYEPQHRPTMIFDHASVVEDDPLGAERQAWDGLESPTSSVAGEGRGEGQTDDTTSP